MLRPLRFGPLLLVGILGCGDSGGGTGGGGGEGTTTSASSASASVTGPASTSASASSGSDGGGGSGEGGDGAGAQGGGGSSGDGGGGGDTGGAGGAGGGQGGGGGAGGGPDCIPEGEVLPLLRDPPGLLSQTGLYASLPDFEVAPNIRSFEPTFPLWSDGAEKARWVYLPECGVIDVTDMDHWDMPVGTRLYKEFAIAGERVETRVMHRFGSDSADWWFAAYQWNDDFTEAVHVPNGVEDASGTTHDIPSAGQCSYCHGFLPEKVLGFSALQLANENDDVTLDILEAEGWLSGPAPEVVVPGDALTVAALGYLHSNCGNCHNETGVFFDVNSPFRLQISVDDATVDDTDAYETAVDVETTSFNGGGVTHRILPGQPELSCVPFRMDTRGSGDQMPPIATEVIDDVGVAAVTAWIEALR